MKRIVFVFVLLITSLSFASLTDGLVGYWPFDGDVKDYSGNGNNGSMHGVSFTDSRNGSSSAAHFDGNDYVSVPASGKISRIFDFSVTAWMKINRYETASNGTKWCSFVSKGGDSIRQFGVQFGVNTNGAAFYQLVAGDRIPCPKIPINTWTHVAVTRSGLNVSLYINGVGAAMGTSKSYPEQHSGDLEIGRDSPGEVEYFHGEMSDVCLFNRKLSAAEVSAIYNGGLKIRKVVFNANAVEVEGAMPSLSVLSGTQEKLPKNAFRRHDGYVSQGWAKSKSDADNGIVKYQDEEEITIESDMTLYAVWANPPLTLSAESADWSSGSITLRCTDVDTSGRTHTYTLQYYDESTDTWKDVSSVQSASASVSLPDTDFSSRLGGIPPVKYRVKDETGRVSAECVTRNRYLISVGYSKFLTKNKAKRGHYNDASQFRNLCVERGDFLSENAHFKGNATTEEIRNEMAYFAANTMPGDLFVFYIATHGGDFREKVFSTPGVAAEARLATYDSTYRVSELLGDVRKFAPGVAVINIIMACHSFSQSGGVEVRETINNWLADCGFAQCLGNVAWITSCDTQQSSYTYPEEDNSRFGQAFIVNGFGHGCADARLFGTKYAGVEPDGLITVGELGRYAKEFFRGLSDDMPSSVQFNENEGLLDRIVIGRRTATPTWSRPVVPANVTASDGYFDTYVKVSWDGTLSAINYRVFRYPLSSPDEWKWIGISNGTTFLDKTATLKCEYGYRVEAVNPIGASDLSYVAVGSRGTSKLIEYIKSLFGVASASAEEYDGMEKTIAANGCRTVGECYALGINPEDPDDDFRIKSFKMDGTKPVVTVNHTEDGSGASLLPRMKMLGKAELSGEWEEVPEEGNPAHRFFTVTVEEP